jgi:hypothetical protein
MKRLFLILGLILSFGLAKAQTATTTDLSNPTPEQRAHSLTLKMQKNLQLTDEQAVKCEAVFLARINEVEAIKADATKTPEQKQIDIDAVNAAKDVELSNIMTPDQFARYKSMKERKNTSK